MSLNKECMAIEFDYGDRKFTAVIAKEDNVILKFRHNVLLQTVESSFPPHAWTYLVIQSDESEEEFCLKDIQNITVHPIEDGYHIFRSQYHD